MNNLQYYSDYINDGWNYVENAISSMVGSCGGYMDECIEELDNIYADVYKGVSKDNKKDPKYIEMTENINNMSNDYNNIEVRICLDRESTYCCSIFYIYVKYPGQKAISVPFELTKNPPYIQDVIDTWFGVYPNDEVIFNLVPKQSLFDYMEKFYQNSRKSKSAKWFEENTEWIKFTFNHTEGRMAPSGFKKYKKTSHEEDVSSSDVW